jgi:hypothetical protein
MRIEELWLEMEREAGGATQPGWLTRFALPSPALPLLVALDLNGTRRALLLPVPINAVPARRDWPDCKGLEIFTVVIAGQPHLGVRLHDRSTADVFGALAEDVAPRVAQSGSPNLAASVLLGRLRRWQKFLEAGTAGLTPAEHRGLYGELHCLRKHLLAVLGPQAVMGWRAPLATHQDFQYALAAVEVKTTAAKQPQMVRVTSERQLDTTGIRALFLHAVVVDERDVEEAVSGPGETLPGLIQYLREILGDESLLAEAFEDALLKAGYLNAHAEKYSNRRFAVRKELTFRIKEGFPAIVERDLPQGTGNVAYDLSLAACQPFSVDPTEMATEIALPPGPIRKMQGA